MKDVDFWLVSTDHLTDRLWFKDDEDYKRGVNLVAVLAAVIPVEILAFILMSNHVHFIIRGSPEDTREYIIRYKKLYSQIYRKRHANSKPLLLRNDYDSQKVSIQDESFERALAYVQMNCVAARISLYPTEYPWGTGSTFFNKTPVRGIKAGTLSERARKHLLHSKIKVPHDYIICNQGYIDPRSYVPVEFVENVFRSPNRMHYFLMSSSKAKKTKEAPSFSDQTLTNAIRELSISLFRKKGMYEMDDTEKSELLKQIRYRFSCEIGQLARVCSLPYDQISSLLEEFD